MDKTLRSGKVALEDQKQEVDTINNQQPRDVEMEQSATDSPSRTAKPDRTGVELTVSLEPDSVAETVCTVCGFSAKCPRSLKIHFARRHGNRSKNAPNNAKPSVKLTETSSVDVNQEAGVETASESKQSQNSDELRGSSDESGNAKSLEKNQEETTQARRVSKRTPKPKIIYSCNYCGQEFWGKSHLDLHVQRSHAKDTPYTFDKDEDMDSEDPKDSGTTAKTAPTRVVTKHEPSRTQLKCPHCDFTVGAVALLENHARAKHLDQQWFRCKLCNFFSATSTWMEAHLSSGCHKQQEKGERSPELSAFEFYVESTTQENRKQAADVVEVEVEGDMAASLKRDLDTDETADAPLDEDQELEPPKKKRGRPKLGSTTTCGYCGLVVSNATNLSVHVRRKHSKEYGYSCTLCNYSCVTKGDMDRHCITKKHVTRMQECANKTLASNHTSGSEEATETQLQEPQMDQESDVATPAECSEDELAQVDANQSQSNVNACSHCDFVAQSLPSLQLHVKRKHTRDFEYVCLACSYYAVTAREMSRHVNTEKHKQKGHKYLEQFGSEGQRPTAPPSKMQEAESGASDEPQPGPDAQAAESEATSDIVVLLGGADETQAENLASASAADPDPPISEPRRTPAESPAESSAEHAEEDAEEDADQDDADEDGMNSEAKGGGPHPDAQLCRAPPFDGCIVSMKSFAVQEKMLQEGLALEGEAAVICLTGGAPVPTSSPYVRKLKQPKAKVREEAKTGSSHIRCEDCGFMADGISGLNVHISMKHPSKEKHFHCLVCGKSFYTESNLHQHLASAAHLRNEQNSVEELPEGGATFKCVKCTDRFETEQDLFVHIKEKHEELLREVNKYVLEDTEQINREREENQGSVCKYCGKVCKSSNSMAFLAHIRTHTGSKPFMCKICNFATAQLGDARNHVKRHLGMREYKCDICGWAFVMKKHLSTHLLGKHGIGQRKERKYECDLCERTFSEKWALNNHKKLHNGEKPYKCAWPSCHYSFLNLSAMKDHYRTHTGEKSYLCDMCGFAGGTRHALTKHRRQHTGERPFKCKFCNFASTTQSHLSRHKRVHTGEKPYRCPWCDYRSNCAENIRKHILHTGKHEGVKMYNCPKCTFGTNSPMEFRNHLKENHADIENPDLAYLHAGIVSKSFECRLKGQGAAYVESDATDPQVGNKAEEGGHDEPVQQVIIIQGYSDGEVAIDQALEESAAATLQTLAMAGQVAEVLHITEDGQVIASGREVASAGTHLVGGGAQYVVLESGEVRGGLQAVRDGVVAAATGQGHVVAESSTALDALLNAVSEMGHQEEVQSEATVVREALAAELVEAAQKEVKDEEEQTEVQVIHQGSQQEMQEVLHLAASQMMKEGLTQVIVNDEGTHYIVTELDNCTLQVEGEVYTEPEAREGEGQQVEAQPGGEMVVYLDGANHNIVLEG